VLLRKDDIKVREHNLQGKKRNQSYDFVNLSVVSEPEQKVETIKSAKKFFEKKLEYFYSESAIKKLLKYADSITSVAQHIVQNSCEIHMKFKNTYMQKSQSLKIDDYQSESASDRGPPAVEHTATTGREVRVDTLTGEPALLSGNRIASHRE
jgi:hypothetical protein